MSGYMTFVDLTELTGDQIQSYLMSQTVPRFDTEPERDAAISAPEDGQLSYVSGVGLCMWDGSWTLFAGSGSGGDTGPAGPQGPQGPAGADGSGAWRGMWDVGAAYAETDVVQRGSNLYQALASSTGVDPPTATTGPTVDTASSASLVNPTAMNDDTTLGSQAAQGFTLAADLTVYGASVQATTLAGDGSNLLLVLCTSTAGAVGELLVGGQATQVVGDVYRATFSAPVELTAGTPYFLATTGSAAGEQKTTSASPLTATGLTFDEFLMYGPTYATKQDFERIPFALYGGTGGAASWALVYQGLPPGGTTGQVLAKVSGDDGDVGWVTA